MLSLVKSALQPYLLRLSIFGKKYSAFYKQNTIQSGINSEMYIKVSESKQLECNFIKFIKSIKKSTVFKNWKNLYPYNCKSVQFCRVHF